MYSCDITRALGVRTGIRQPSLLALRFDENDVCAVTWALTVLRTVSIDVPGNPTKCTQLLKLRKDIDPPPKTWFKAKKWGTISFPLTASHGTDCHNACDLLGFFYSHVTFRNSYRNGWWASPQVRSWFPISRQKKVKRLKPLNGYSLKFSCTIWSRQIGSTSKWIYTNASRAHTCTGNIETVQGPGSYVASVHFFSAERKRWIDRRPQFPQLHRSRYAAFNTNPAFCFHRPVRHTHKLHRKSIILAWRWSIA